MIAAARDIVEDHDGHLMVTFQQAVRAIAQLVAPARATEFGDMANTSPNQVRRVLDVLLSHYPVAAEQEENVLRIARAYGELRLVRSLGSHLSQEARSGAEAWSRLRIRRRMERRRAEREAGAAFDSHPESLGGDIPDDEVRIFHAAIRLFDGTLLGGPRDGTHPDVVEALDPAMQMRVRTEVESEGFVDSYGNYLDRGQASIVTNVAGESSEIAGTVQGVPLRKVQEESLREDSVQLGGITLDDEEASEAVDFLDQFRTDRAL
jgi:hypothetical protein